jgi:hypothetical protein
MEISAMTTTKYSITAATLTALGLILSAAAGCSEEKAEAKSEATPPPSGLQPRQVADMLHAVMEADRTVYTRNVVNRLIKEQKVQVVNPESKQPEPFGASEHWKSEHGKLPLPAQMFRMGAEAVTKKDVGFTYALLSKWPINKQNKPKTPIEVKGLDEIVKNEGEEPFYGTEELGGTKYFTAVYADVGVASACIDCHNDHKDSPRRDFELDDVMGGVVIRIPL